MNHRAMLLMLLLVVWLPGCGMRKHAAEASFVEVESDYGRMRDQMLAVAPDRAQSIDMAMAVAKETLDKGDDKEALRMTKELQTLLRETSDRLPTMRTELQSAWKSLSTSLPGTLASLRRDLKLANRPPTGSRRAAFDAARGTLLELVDQWEAAQAAMRDGKLAEAVTKAEDVKSRALGLVNGTHEGS